MSSILSSTAAPAPSVNPGAKTATRSDEPDQNNAESFGQALARSLGPAEEKTEKPLAKTAALALARRQSDKQKPDTDELVNTMALSFVPLESRSATAALPDAVGTAAISAAGTDVPEAVIDADALSARASVLAATDQRSASQAPLPKGFSSAVPATEAAPLAKGSTGNAPEVTIGAETLPKPVSVLAAASQKSAAQPPLQATDAVVNEGTAIQTDPLAVAAQGESASAGLFGQSPKHDGKIATNPTADAPDATVSAVAGSQVGTDATVSTSAALSINPATAGLQAPGGVSASNAPAPTTSATPMPEVGAGDWGKALGQHVVQMSNAGHQVAELQLNPPGLGPLKVTLSMNEQQMQAMFVSAHASVRAAVEAALPQLRATLAESGISLGNTSVGAESQQQQPAFSSSQSDQPESGAYRRAEMASSASMPPVRTLADPARRNSGLRIDTYA